MKRKRDRLRVIALTCSLQATGSVLEQSVVQPSTPVALWAGGAFDSGESR
ncbi:hypothetical protein [Streptomyces sp. NPDC057199]